MAGAPVLFHLYPLLHALLQVLLLRHRLLVLGHRLRVLLRLCLGWFLGAVPAVLVLVHPLLYGRLLVLVLGHRPPVFLRSIKVRLCGWCYRARAAVPTASDTAAGALTRASCVAPCAAVFPYSHSFLLAVFSLEMLRRTTEMRNLLCFSSQADFFMTRKCGRGVLKAPTKRNGQGVDLSVSLDFFHGICLPVRRVN